MSFKLLFHLFLTYDVSSLSCQSLPHQVALVRLLISRKQMYLFAPWFLSEQEDFQINSGILHSLKHPHVV